MDRRRGAAAVEMAVVTAALLVPTIIGLWEVGRLVYVMQVVSHAAREGARLAAQAYTINPDGTQIEIRRASGTPNVTTTVYQSLLGSGLTNLQPNDVQVQFEFLAPRSDGVTPDEPFQGERNQPFAVRVSVPWERVRWVNLGLIQPANVEFTVRWRMLIDERFSINTQLPQW